MPDTKEALKNVISSAKVMDAPEILSKYSQDNSFVKGITPNQVVQVSNVDEVQKIVQWANQTQTPLIPVSSGGPHFKGDTLPSVPQAVIVDLSGMKKILDINRRYRMAYVEPGVTYGELQTALAKEGMTLSTSLAPRNNKSVLTSVLEIEPRLNPRHQWAYMDPLRCMQVVWGDGNKMLTGEAGMGDADIEKQWKAEKRQVQPTGPAQFDFPRILTAAQGSMGIVTWASLKCELLPQVHKLNFAAAPRVNDLLDLVYRILKLRFADELMIMNNTYLANLLGKSHDRINELKNQLPAWMALIGIAGCDMLPEERVEGQTLDIAEMAQQFGLKTVPSVSGATGTETLKALINPSPEPYWKLTYKGNFQDIFFVTTLDKTPQYIDAMYRLAGEYQYPSSDIGVYIQPQHAGTSCHCEFNLPYDPENKQESKRMYDYFLRASNELSQMGAYYARPYGIWSRLQFNKDAQTTVTLKSVKGIFDPNGIMNPGKLCNY